jgi:hypothetical protein
MVHISLNVGPIDLKSSAGLLRGRVVRLRNGNVRSLCTCYYFHRYDRLISFFKFDGQLLGVAWPPPPCSYRPAHPIWEKLYLIDIKPWGTYEAGLSITLFILHACVTG